MISHIIIWRIIDERKAVYTLVVTAGQTTSFKRADEEQTGAITIYKEGEVLTGWDGTNFVYEVRKLPGATFRVVAAEDIYRADGALVYHKGDIVSDNLTTGKDGQVVVNNLHLGTYSVIETRSIDGYTINGNPVTVKIEYKDQTVSVQYEDATIRNERQHANVSVLKCDSVTKNPLSGGEYTLYAGNDIRNYDGTIIMYAGDVIQTVTTGRDGKEDITSGEELSGATLSVIDSEGKVIETWTSRTGEKHVIKRLIVGHTYILREEYAPYGYLRAAENEFTVLDGIVSHVCPSTISVVLNEENIKL